MCKGKLEIGKTEWEQQPLPRGSSVVEIFNTHRLLQLSRVKVTLTFIEWELIQFVRCHVAWETPTLSLSCWQSCREMVKNTSVSFSQGTTHSTLWTWFTSNRLLLSSLWRKDWLKGPGRHTSWGWYSAKLHFQTDLQNAEKNDTVHTNYFSM